MSYRKKRRRRNRIDRILAFCLACLLAVGIFSGTGFTVLAASLEDAWDGASMTVPQTDEEGTYLIYNAKELAWFANRVNTGSSDINGSLMDTVYLNNNTSNYEWIMIGCDEEHPYRGTFDGKGNSVNYMYVSSTEADSSRRYIGLFGVIDGGEVRNVKVSGNLLQGYGNDLSPDSLIETAAGSGGIAGYLKSGTIYSCQNYVKTTMAGRTRYRNAGGIAGIVSGEILHCTNYGKISTDVGYAQRNVGGIAGLVTGPKASVRYSLNRASVQGYFDVGGIAGSVKYGAEIRSSANYSSVNGNETVGGIAGFVTRTGTRSNGSAKECYIRDVCNLGEVSGYNDYVGQSLGGIVGFLGYESWAEAELPCMPVVENAYSAACVDKVVFYMRGAAIGQFRSGSIGNLYCLKSGDAEMVGAQENKVTSYTSTLAFKTSTQMKKQDFADLLGPAFVRVSSMDRDTSGYPKLAWQVQESELSFAVDLAVMELNSWLTESNRNLYGKNFSKIENLVAAYLELLDQVTSTEQLDKIMADARADLAAVKPGRMDDQERNAAIDEALSAFGEYYSRLLEEHPELTDDQKAEIQKEKEAAEARIRGCKNEEEIDDALEDAKNILDEKLAAYEKEKSLEDIRSSYLTQLENYESGIDRGDPWNSRIEEERAAGTAAIEAAWNVVSVEDAFREAKRNIDLIIASVPTEDSWDGITKEKPAADQNGVYLITNAAQLAWFADQVNNGPTQTLHAALQNDIHLGGHEWTPIGNGTKIFSGTFDGAGHTIRGLYVSEASEYAGLFGRIYGTSTRSITDLTVYGNINCQKNVTYAGGIVGYISGQNDSTRTAVTNCRSYVNVTLAGITKMNSSAGGIAGYAIYTWFRECENNGEVSIPSVGKGGVTYFAGGILGQASHSTTVRRSCNKGSVEAENCAGGLVGRVMNSGCEFTSNYNRGAVIADNYAGGLAGLIESTAVDCSFRYSYNSGAVNLDRSAKYSGALFGSVNGGGCEEVFALRRADQTGLELVGYTADNSSEGQFVSSQKLAGDAMLNTLNVGGSYFIRDYLQLQEGYPMFGWQMTLDQFKEGAINELHTFVAEEEYTPENWEQVQALVEAGVTEIRSAANFAEVNEILSRVREAVYAIESLEDVRQKELDAAKEAALKLIEENYSDLSAYRDKERLQIETMIADARILIFKAKNTDTVEQILTNLADNIGRIKTAEEYAAEEERSAIAAVVIAIDDIGEVVLQPYVHVAIQTARDLYDKLTEEQQEKVENYQKLLDAEAEWQRLMEEADLTEEDLDAAAAVDTLIETIGPADSVTPESKAAVDKARASYDALSDKQKTAVERLPELEAAEAALDKAFADEVRILIAELSDPITLDNEKAILAAQEAYDKLTDQQKELVTDHDKLVAAGETLLNLKKAAQVMELIDAIGKVTTDSKDSVTAAVEAYNDYSDWLSDPKRGWKSEQKDLVSNYLLLEKAVKDFAALDKVAKAEKKIDRIGTVALTDASLKLIQDARSAFNALTEAEKRLVKAEKKAALEAAEKAYETLKKEKEDEESNKASSEIINDGQMDDGSGEDYEYYDPGSGDFYYEGEDDDYYYGYTYVPQTTTTTQTLPNSNPYTTSPAASANADPTPLPAGSDKDKESKGSGNGDFDDKDFEGIFDDVEDESTFAEGGLYNGEDTLARADEEGASGKIRWDLGGRPREEILDGKDTRAAGPLSPQGVVKHPMLWVLVLILGVLMAFTILLYVTVRKAEEKRGRKRVRF